VHLINVMDAPMVMTNAITNGSFNLGNAGWSGNDLETSYGEAAYLGNGSSNQVAEMDGYSGQTTVMQQTFTLTDDHTTELTFRSALRTASLPNAGLEGFRVDILNSSGGVVATQSFFPTTTGWTNYSMPVDFQSAGTYTVRFTELGSNDSLGAIIDDVSMLVCFTAGTLIDTAKGPRAVEALAVGDLIWTLDAGLQPLRWIGQRHVMQAELQADASLRPVVFEAGALGDGLPLRRMAVSPQHRLCRGNWRTELYFGEPEVLVPALSLINGTSVRQAEPDAAVTYVHFLLDGHQIVRSDGALTESFFPSRLALTGLDRAARIEVLRLFPDLESLSLAYPHTARPVLRHAVAHLAA
jgi:hypothetical protein